MISPMAPAIVVTQRVQAAGMRAIESHSRVRRLAMKLGEEMDELTGPIVVPVRPSSQGDFLDEEDSLVTTVGEALVKTSSKG
jgi:hypothetical protein